LWQFWQFVAAGLFPHERQYITRYIPLSIGLLISGMLFVYFFVLPWTLQFFIAFSIGVPLTETAAPTDVNPPTTQATFVQVARGNPANLQEGQLWYDQVQRRFKIFLEGEVKVISFSAQNLIATEYKLPAYIDLVVGMLITFGLSFQLPLAVLTLVRVGIVDRDTLKKSRQYVYFAIAVLAAVITPGDYITGTVLLIFPLILLYELGIWLSRNPRIESSGH
ncbi:MAG: twin-arginine translocase subunit TatC, partial [Tepidisphaeraceae bacterium]